MGPMRRMYATMTTSSSSAGGTSRDGRLLSAVAIAFWVSSGAKPPKNCSSAPLVGSMRAQSRGEPSQPR